MDIQKARRTILILFVCSTLQNVRTDVTLCSDYLVSGLDGVQITDISASTSWAPTHDTKYARLYTAVFSQAWVTGTNDAHQYIQVKLPREATVYAILLQGRGLTSVDQFVKTYFVSYSNDSITWTDVSQPGGSPQLFTGNSNRNGVVKANIDPGITGTYFRIKPQTWNGHISLRFDVSGCYKIESETSIGKETFSRISIVTSSVFTEGPVLDTSTTSFPACATECKKIQSCITFTFNKTSETCRGFNTLASGPYGGFSSLDSTSMWFVKTGRMSSLGFRKLQGTGKQYKVIEVARNQSSAKDLCAQYSSRLIYIETISEMTTVQNIIAGNVILSRNFQFYVSGEYVNTQWHYSGSQEVIVNGLWSPGNPDASVGHCVMLRETGFVSTDCTRNIFFVCGL